MGTGSAIEQGLRFLRNIILARLLAPEAFGVMAIVLAINQAFETFTEIGIQSAIIQNPKGRERTYLNGAWWLAMTRAVGLYGLAYYGAPWIAGFYHNPELLPLLRITFLAILFKGAISPGLHIAIKQMNFKHWVIAHHGGALFGILATFILAGVMQNIWALVLGFTLESAARCVLSYLVFPFRPGLSFDRQHWRALIKYTGGVAGLPILTFIFMRADVFVLGKLFSPADLGLYSMASSIAQVPLQLIGGIVAPIVMPAFSALQADKARINTAILKVTSIIAFLGVPLLVGAILYGKDLLMLAYGTQYGKVAVPFAIILSTAVLQTVCVPIFTFYMAIGRPALHRLFAAIRTLLVIILIYPAVKYFGLAGAAAAGLVAMFLGYLYQVIWIREVIQFDLRQYGAIFLQALGVSACVAVLWLVTRDLFPARPLLNMLPGAMGCLLAYGISIIIFLQSKSRLS